MKKFVLLSLLSLFLIGLAGCSTKDGLRKDSDLSGSKYGSEWADEGNQGEYQAPQAGQLTASEWSDIYNYDFYLSLFESSQESEQGIFTPYYQKGYFDTLNMVTVLVKNGDQVLSGAQVALQNVSEKTVYTGVTNLFGYTYLFPKTLELDLITKIKVTYNGQTINVPYEYSTDNDQIEIDLEVEDNHQEVLELMFVIDTTGSMGDEISYLKSEIDYVISEVQNDNPNSTIRLALLFYRDFGDEYVTRYFDFTTDINQQKANLSAQSAAGGGDFEEAVDVALDEAVTKGWSTDNTTKLLFHVLDARPHYEQNIMLRYYNAIYSASEKGIRIIPVASSGIDKYTEYLLRNEAMMTGGTYVFLTNHSGIGEDHLEATVGETVVEYLNHLLIRLINEYHTGVIEEKIPYYQK